MICYSRMIVECLDDVLSGGNAAENERWSFGLSNAKPLKTCTIISATLPRRRYLQSSFRQVVTRDSFSI